MMAYGDFGINSIKNSTSTYMSIMLYFNIFSPPHYHFHRQGNMSTQYTDSIFAYRIFHAYQLRFKYIY